ncbi:MAG: FKBP-type peptidyl-prolyl cis-trans isomerase [Actinomycetales bacterium]|nr:FKBP-type peptidyl-prolyl cis-trans isomerase [Actinomycetales bacterium]
MRKTLAAVLVAGALALTACSSDATDTETTTPATASPTGIEIGGDGPFPETSTVFGETPELAFPDDEPSTRLEVSVLAAGDGEAVEAGDLLVVDYLGQVWGGEVFDSSFERTSPAAFSIGTGQVIQGWDAGLVGQDVGSRVILSIPPELGYGTGGNPDAGIEGTDTLVFVVDIIGSYPTDVTGSADAAVTPEAATTGLEITGTPGEPASVSVPEGTAAPTESSATVLATADGEPVVAGGVIVQYAVAYWDNSSTGSTWDAGQPQAVEVGTGGEFDALIGVPIGSRVLLLIPAPDEATPAIAAVVDIIDQVSTS